MMQLENIVSQAQQRPFHLNLDRAPQKKSAKAHVFLGHGKNTLGLDTAIHTNQLSFVSADAFFHRFSLSGKALGDIDSMAHEVVEIMAPVDAVAAAFLKSALEDGVDRKINIQSVERGRWGCSCSSYKC